MDGGSRKKIVQRSQRILVPSANVVKLYPMWGDGEPIYLWAENGLVCWENAATDGYGTMKWADCADRVLALSQMTFKSSEERSWQTERRKMQKFVADMEPIIRQAKDQGCPDAPDSGAERKRRGRKQSVVPRDFDNVVARF